MARRWITKSYRVRPAIYTRQAKTIHRTLEVDPRAGGFKRDVENPLYCDLLDVDEVSIIDVMLMQALLKAVPDHAAPSTSATTTNWLRSAQVRVLADIIASGAVPVVRLTEVFRQAAQSRIITSAHRCHPRSLPANRAIATSTSCRPTTPKPPCRGSST